MNALIALQLIIQLTEQLQKVTSLLRDAQAQNRDVNSEELEELKKADDVARRRLQDLMESHQSLAPQWSGQKAAAFAQPALTELEVDPVRGTTAAESLAASEGEDKVKEAEKANHDEVKKTAHKAGK